MKSFLHQSVLGCTTCLSFFCFDRVKAWMYSGRLGLYSWRSGLGSISLPNSLPFVRLRVVNIPSPFGLGIGMLRFGGVLLLSFFLIFDLAADSGDAQEDLLARAESAYQQAQYQEALLLWDSLRHQGHISKYMLYDMGLAAYQLGKYALALAYAQRAFDEDPLFDEAADLARLARIRLDAPEPSEVFFLSRWWHIFYTRLSANFWSLLALLFFWGAGFYLLFLYRRHKLFFELRSFTLVASFLFLGVLSLGAAYSKAVQFRHPQVLIALVKQGLHVGADEDSPVLEELPEGATLRYLDQIGRWYKVEAPSGQLGWVASSAVEGGL